MKLLAAHTALGFDPTFVNASIDESGAVVLRVRGDPVNGHYGEQVSTKLTAAEAHAFFLEALTALSSAHEHVPALIPKQRG